MRFLSLTLVILTGCLLSSCGSTSSETTSENQPHVDYSSTWPDNTTEVLGAFTRSCVATATSFVPPSIGVGERNQIHQAAETYCGCSLDYLKEHIDFSKFSKDMIAVARGKIPYPQYIQKAAKRCLPPLKRAFQKIKDTVSVSHS